MQESPRIQYPDALRELSTQVNGRSQEAWLRAMRKEYKKVFELTGDEDQAMHAVEGLVSRSMSDMDFKNTAIGRAEKTPVKMDRPGYVGGRRVLKRAQSI